MVTLNGTNHEVATEIVEGITARLHSRLLRVKNDYRLNMDDLAVITESRRLYPALDQKVWFKDFIIQFCKDRRIPCRSDLI